jgi:hypothetical protein
MERSIITTVRENGKRLPSWHVYTAHKPTFLKLQPWQSSDQIEFTQARQMVKSSSDPNSYATSTTQSKNQQKSNSLIFISPSESTRPRPLSQR